MTTFFFLLPLYLVGNFHCFGMCGPLVMLLGKHRYRFYYFLGRTTAFTFVAGLAGAIGQLVEFSFPYELSFAFTLLFGFFLLLLGLFSFFSWTLTLPASSYLSRRVAKYLLEDKRHSVFLFGLATILLPCGQSLIVFSACAVTGSFVEGVGNGFAFAVLTSPGLLAALQAHHLFAFAKSYYNQIMGVVSAVVGTLAILRALATFGYIEHLHLNQALHIVLY